MFFNLELDESQARNLITVLAISNAGWRSLQEKGLATEQHVIAMSDLHKYVCDEINRQKREQKAENRPK